MATKPSQLASRHRQALRHIDTSIDLPLSSSFRPLGHINGGVKLQRCSVLACQGGYPGTYCVLTTISALPICLVDYPGRHLQSKSSRDLPLSSSFRPLGHINGGVKLQRCSVLACQGGYPGTYCVLTTISALPICLVDYPGRHLQSKSSRDLPLSSSFRPLGHINGGVKLQRCSVLACQGGYPGTYCVLTTISALPICLVDYSGRHLQSKSSRASYPGIVLAFPCSRVFDTLIPTLSLKLGICVVVKATHV